MLTEAYWEIGQQVLGSRDKKTKTKRVRTTQLSRSGLAATTEPLSIELKPQGTSGPCEVTLMEDLPFLLYYCTVPQYHNYR